MSDLINRQAAIDVLAEDMPQAYTPDGSHPADEGIFMAQEIYADCIQALKELPPIQPDIVRCKDCQYWNSGSCEYPEHAVNCQDYMIGDIETEAEHFCGHAKRREVTEEDAEAKV